MNITHRKATEKDLKTLYDLGVLFTEFNSLTSGERKRFFWDNWEKDFEEEILSDLQNPHSFFFLAEDTESKPIGYILARYCKDCEYYVIDELFVIDEYRNKNVGQQMLKMAVAEGKKYTKNIRVEIFNWNENAKRFYLRNGFKEDAIVLEFAHPTEPTEPTL